MVENKLQSEQGNPELIALIAEMQKQINDALKPKPSIFHPVITWFKESVVPWIIVTALLAFTIGGVTESKLHFFERAPILKSESGLTQTTKNLLKTTIPDRYQDDFSTAMKSAITETMEKIEQEEFQDQARTDGNGKLHIWKASDQARTEISLLFQANLSAAETSKNYSKAGKAELAQSVSAFLKQLGERLLESSAGRDDLETVQKLYGDVARGL